MLASSGTKAYGFRRSKALKLLSEVRGWLNTSAHFWLHRVQTMSNETKKAAEAASGARVRSYDYTLSELDLAVVRQLGGEGRNTADGCEISEDAAAELENVRACSCGAAGGFSGFIYYSETREFTAANREAIVARLREQIDEGLFTDSDGKPRGVVGKRRSFYHV